ncbi:PPE family protein [Mycobacterium shimoidei]|uniref:PPE family protein n=1 Tax=Mycobacterium shimoidei TaxID=29313 RepID=UPI000848F8E9|nr:PPE family protein [Mycobacterium shimoidei]MCV7259057.1 PPE family protein [Mycobacterium shimoidei]ODR13268.1 hypothetical protein BHQ16_10995 [Mycobacterium shimoidei]ORW83276.1 hypothetical protein AWC26_02320 [Mycobacterium shimoidei]
MDFAALPPEINSGRMYAGPGSGSMLAAAATWDELSTELYTAAASYQSVISALTSGPWRGPSSISMASAAAPFAAWLSATAAQAEQTSNQAKAAAAAHAAAFAMTVPPPVVAANRAQLAALVATNILGQNTPAIAATEAQYDEMWAQDATAMYGYAAASQTASQMTPFATPHQTTNPGALASQGAAVSQSGGTSAGHAAVSHTLSAVSQAAEPSGLDSLGSLSDIWAIPQDALFDTAIIAAFVPEYCIAGAALPSPFGLAATAPAAIAAAEPLGLLPVEASAGLAGASVSAGLGQATSMSGLSVPQSWATAAPEMRLAAAELPISNVVAAEGGGLFRGMPLFGGAPLMTLAGNGPSPRGYRDPEESRRKAAKGRRSTMR